MDDFYINVDVDTLKKMISTGQVLENNIVISKYNVGKIADFQIIFELEKLLSRVKYRSYITCFEKINISIVSKKVPRKVKESLNKRFNYNININRVLFRLHLFSNFYTFKEKFRCLIHMVKSHEIDKIFWLDRKEMLRNKYSDFNKGLKDFGILERRKEDIYMDFPVFWESELMGCYIKISDDEISYKNYFNNINKKVEEDDENIICLCKETMEEIINRKYIHVNDVDVLCDMVLAHEFGHLVFSYLKNDDAELREKQANYFSSLCFESKLDHEILELTMCQPSAYHNPILLSHRLNDFENYEDRVDGLYMGKLV